MNLQHSSSAKGKIDDLILQQQTSDESNLQISKGSLQKRPSCYENGAIVVTNGGFEQWQNGKNEKIPQKVLQKAPKKVPQNSQNVQAGLGIDDFAMKRLKATTQLLLEDTPEPSHPLRGPQLFQHYEPLLEELFSEWRTIVHADLPDHFVKHCLKTVLVTVKASLQQSQGKNPSEVRPIEKAPLLSDNGK